MNETKEPLFAVVMANHKGCPLASLKAELREKMGATEIQGVIRRSPSKHIATITVKSSDLKDVCTAIKRLPEGLELIQILTPSEKPEESQIYCYLQDPILDIRTKDKDGTFWIPEYKLYESYLPFNNRPAEYFRAWIPDRQFFLDHVHNLKSTLGREAEIEYGFRYGIEKAEVPGFSIKEQHIVESVLETKYFENEDKKELQALANELGEDLDKLVETAEELCGLALLKGSIAYFSR